MFSLAIFAQSGTLEAIRQSFPTDPASLFALALCAVAVIAIVIGGRSKGKGSGPSGAA